MVPPSDEVLGPSSARLTEAQLHSADELLPILYAELRALAKRRFRDERPGATLQPTALVHEAWLRLVGEADPGWNSRGHFFGAAAQAMRRILVEKARHKARLRHGGDQRRVELGDQERTAGGVIPSRAEEILAVDQVLERLETRHPRKAKLAELRFFAGLTVPECAAALGVSVGTVERDWRFLKAWLLDQLASPESLHDWQTGEPHVEST
ncbi:MAG: sigma-70 family RNA polymerase sigma factor [Acidobacteriota bacterium]